MKPLADVLFGRCRARNKGVIIMYTYNYALVNYFVSLIIDSTKLRIDLCIMYLHFDPFIDLT